MKTLLRAGVLVSSMLAATAAHAGYRNIPTVANILASVGSNCMVGSDYSGFEALDQEFSFNPVADMSAASLATIQGKLNDGNPATAVTVTLNVYMTVNYASSAGGTAAAEYDASLFYGDIGLDAESDVLTTDGSASRVLTFTIPEGTNLSSGLDLSLVVAGGASFECGGPPGVSASVYAASARLRW